MRGGRKRGLALLALVAVVAQAAALPVLAADIPAGLEWSGRAPVSVTFGDNVDNRWDNYLRGGSKDWGRSPVVNTRVAGGQAGARLCNPRDKRGFNRGRAEVCNGRYGNTRWLGLTYVYAQGKTIVAARVFVNDTYFLNGQYDDPEAKRHTMTHELGHALGLQHAGGKSVMNDSAAAIFRYDEPTGSDYQRLRNKYGGGGRAADADAADAAPDETVTVEDVGDGIDLYIIEVLAK